MSARLTIHLDRIVANYRTCVRLSSPARCAAVVKADAYGLGVAAVAPALAAAGCPLFFVATPAEGMELRAILTDAGYPEADVAVFNGFAAPHRKLFLEQRLIPVLNTRDQLRHWPHPAFVQVETGMHRSGLPEADWAHAQALLTAPPLAIMSHLACADTPEHPANAQQLAAFRRALRLFRAPGSLAASCGLHQLGADYLFDLTRPGAALYGAIPHPGSVPVITLTAPILEVRDVDAGEGVGYGHRFVADRPRRIATVGIGYADGYPRGMQAGRAFMLLADQRLPVVGRVSMDLVTLDVTDAPAAQPGKLVTVYGADYTVNDAAEAAGTIGYEILTRLGQRLSRQYVFDSASTDAPPCKSLSSSPSVITS
jgi:alanine racemase